MPGRKTSGTRADGLDHTIQIEEIETDAFELWIGISRLMQRLRGLHLYAAKARPVRRGRRPR